MSGDSEQLPYESEEWILAKCAEIGLTVPPPTSDYMIDLDGNFYSEVVRGKGWIPNGWAEPDVAAPLRGITAVPQAQAVNGRYLYDPSPEHALVLDPPRLEAPIYIKQNRGSHGCALLVAVIALIVLVAAVVFGIRIYHHLTTPKIPKADIPQITHVSTYRKGVLVYFSIRYRDPGNYAEGFGFVGIDGAGWAEENHPFSSPSYGIVHRRKIAYPFNLACGTGHAYQSDVEAWIYDKAGDRSKPVDIHLAC